MPEEQQNLFDQMGFPQHWEESNKQKKLTIQANKLASINEQFRENRETINGIPPLELPTRWEFLKLKIDTNKVPPRAIIQPIPKAMSEVRNIAEYLRTTGGSQVLVIRGDTGSGKTTFLNTLPVYMNDVEFNIITIDIEPIEAEDFYEELEKLKVDTSNINVIVLEGREKPESVTDRYIQILLSNINRFSRSKRVPLLFVIPTIEEQVARNWCDHGIKIGDLIPKMRLHEGSRWYTFPGVAKAKYKEIVEETVRALNPPYDLYDFGISPTDVNAWSENSHTIGQFIETLASRVSELRGASLTSHEGRKNHVWIVYCCPDLRHSDHTYLVMDSLSKDDKLRASPTKLIPLNSPTSFSKSWREHPQWAKFVATINYLDIRLINFPISTLVTAAMTYCDDKLLQSFKETYYRDYRDKVPQEMLFLSEKSDKEQEKFDWNQPLVERRLQVQNARDSIAKTNLFFLLRGMPAEQQKGGRPESLNSYIKYLHLRNCVSEEELHYYIGCALRDTLEHYNFPELIGIENETSIVRGESSPEPDATVHTKSDIYALEFHFRRKQIAPSEASRYAVKNVIEKYMKGLSYLRSILATIT